MGLEAFLFCAVLGLGALAIGAVIEFWWPGEREDWIGENGGRPTR